jgi:hypothetical protein
VTNRAPARGDIVLYPYLWAAQHERGENEGRKTRPTCLVLRFHDTVDDIDYLVLLAITSQQPTVKQHAVEVPEMERRREAHALSTGLGNR